MHDERALDHPVPAHPVSVPADPRSVVAELVCADPGLLRVEFDALIAANYPPAEGARSRRPPRHPGSLATDRSRPVIASLAAAVRGPAWTRPGAAPRRRARERSPPRQTHTRDAHPSRRPIRIHGQTKEVRDRSMSPLNESDGPALVTTMIDPPDGSCPSSADHLRRDGAPAPVTGPGPRRRTNLVES